jgi:hypothetical protein
MNIYFFKSTFKANFEEFGQQSTCQHGIGDPPFNIWAAFDPSFGHSALGGGALKAANQAPHA